MCEPPSFLSVQRQQILRRNRDCVRAFFGLVTVVSGVGVYVRRGDKGGARNTHTWVQLPPLYNNNNRRRDVFYGEEEARHGRLKERKMEKNLNGRHK